MKGNDIRESYLSFFENKKDHLRLKSFSLIPKEVPKPGTIILIPMVTCWG